MARTFGGATTDKVVTGLTSHATLRSYSMWTYRTGGGGNGAGRFFDKRVSSGAVEFFFNNNASSQYSFIRQFTTAGEWRITSPAADSWHALTLTFDCSSASNDPIMYLDGSSVTVTENQTPTGTVVDNSDAYVIGNRANDNLRNWAGRLAWFSVWDVILNANEAAAFAGGVQPWRIRPESLVCCLPLWGLHSPELDFIRVNGTGTVTGTVLANDPPVSPFTSLIPLFEQTAASASVFTKIIGERFGLAGGRGLA